MNPAVKNLRKQRRAQHRLARDMNIKCSDEPTQCLMICNAGLVTGLRRDDVDSIVNELVPSYNLIMPVGKSYCFLKLRTKEHAQIVFDALHGKLKFQDKNTPLYLSFTETVPSADDDLWNKPLPPGLRLIEEFITLEEEDFLLKFLDWTETGTNPSELKHRQVKHFGYEFRYDTNKVDPDNPIAPIPESYKFLLTRFKEHQCGNYDYDQLTINRYLPGQGIPPHIDTHSPFEDTILSLSLGSPCVMEFKRGEERRLVFLSSRSLLVMSGEARYAWIHGIVPRHNDVIRNRDGITVLQRSTRTSFTFRKLHSGDCRCSFEKYCDSRKNYSSTIINNNLASDIENTYVHKVYEQISDHFSETRHKPWPNVTKFIESLDKGGLLLDVGCGNGKYLHGRPDIFKVGCDRSFGLTDVCHGRGFEVLLADCLHIPYKNDSLDAVISIAVIHHLSTIDRRKQAISEITRVLKPGGHCLIYVWAKEQKKNSVASTYLKSRTNEHDKLLNDLGETVTIEGGAILPVHENRTEFTHSDMLVPWKRKGGGNFLRFYHVFEEGELSSLCSELHNVLITNTYYDQGNWCIILEKVKS
ncbi:alkylated DNA repair protein alkB homolog 8 [Neodiprion pinetum]|uniref:alkylated DNA repair protein alkB homolog 8 n=1 Tax=Neodiprion pinetum TaxID=441929 RepID=UPI001EDF8D24|nr:alkylated DNA repair protein alkB homolog 8 [Neodiprion pinetum]